MSGEKPGPSQVSKVVTIRKKPYQSLHNFCYIVFITVVFQGSLVIIYRGVWGMDGISFFCVPLPFATLLQKKTWDII